MFRYPFAGGSYGCLCNISGYSLVLEGLCTDSLSNSGCRDVPNVPAFNNTHWNSNAASFCVARSSVSLANESSLPAASRKQCGSTESAVLVPISENCPIVNITLEPTLLEENQRTSQTTPPFFMSWSPTSPFSQRSLPVVLFKVSEHQFCLFFADQGITPGRADFPLAQTPRGCPKSNFTASPPYSVLDSIPQSTFFAANSQLSGLSAKVGYYPPSNYSYLLGYSNAPLWTASCRYVLPGLSVASATDFMQLKADRVSNICSWVLAVLSGLIFLAGFLAFVNYYFEQEKHQPIWILLALLATWLGSVALGVLLTYNKSGLVGWTQSVLTNNCTDNRTASLVIAPYATFYHAARLENYILLGLIGFGILLLVVFCAYLIRVYSLNTSFWLFAKPEPVDINPPADLKEDFVQKPVPLEQPEGKDLMMDTMPMREELRVDDSLAELKDEPVPRREIKVRRRNRIGKITDIVRRIKQS